MHQLKKSIIPFLVIMATLFILFDFGDGEIDYDNVAFGDLPEKSRDLIAEGGPGGTGMFVFNGYTYAFIGTDPDEKVTIEFVGDAHDGIGKEVRYRVTKRGDHEPTNVIHGSYGEFAVHVIRLEKEVSMPFGFYKID